MIAFQNILTEEEVAQLGQDAGRVLQKGMPRADLTAREQALRQGIVAHSACWQLLKENCMDEADLPTQLSEAIRDYFVIPDGV